VTITVKLYGVAGLFDASRAFHVTVVNPELKAILLSVVPVPVVAPVRVYVSDETEQLSVAVAFQPMPVWT
jgi:hypothetical protein